MRSFPHWITLCLAAAFLDLVGVDLHAQVEIRGRLILPSTDVNTLAEDHSHQEGEGPSVRISEVRAIAATDDLSTEPRGFRTWEMPPTGWFRFSGPPGRYTILLTEPSHYLPPIIVTNLFLDKRAQLVDGLRVSPHFSFRSLSDSEWDHTPVTGYLQPFVADAPYVTHVGIKLATDGVDGPGPLSNRVLISIHRITPDEPSQWPQIGPTMPIEEVDCGGPKSYVYSAGWNTGEVPVTKGELYAVKIVPDQFKHPIQSFWTDADTDDRRCLRHTNGRWESTAHRLWLTVACTGDTMLIPYNKRVHRRFGEFAGSSQQWTQTYVAQGNSIAGIMLYAAVSGAQPPLSRQRVRITIRKAGPDGPIVRSAVAIGEGHYTGDASWGVFARCFAPDQVVVTPGETYAIDFASLESPETVGGFVNIKGQTSDGRPAFNPYRKFGSDDYPLGTAVRAGVEEVPLDLDMQVIEYAHSGTNWERATTGPQLLESVTWTRWQRDRVEEPTSDNSNRATKWSVLQSDDNRDLSVRGDPTVPTNSVWSCVVSSLDRRSTFRLSGEFQSTWAWDADHACQIGWDATGQTSDPDAGTIEWSDGPSQHTTWQLTESPPIRPSADRISVWLRATSRPESIFPFVAKFRALSLRCVDTRPPQGTEIKRSGLTPVEQQR